MRDFEHHSLLGYPFWGVLTTTYSQDVTTDINTKYVKRRSVLCKNMPFGVAKPYFNIYTPFFP